MSPRLVRAAAVAVAVAVAAVFFYLRVTASRSLTFPAPGEVRLFDTDPYYHTRHATYAATHYPHLLRWDPALYPDGYPAFYVGLFDLTIATAAFVAGGGHPTADLTLRVAAWVPPFIGAAAVLALFWLGWVIGGPIVGALAAVLLLLHPGLFANRALLGYPDHHVAEVLLGLLTAIGVARLLQRAHGDRPPPPWRPALLEALPLAVFFFTWFGAPIYFILIAIALFLAATVEIGRGAGGGAIGAAAVRYSFGLAILIAVAWLIAPWLVMDVPKLRLAFSGIVIVAAGMPLYTWFARVAVARGMPAPLAALIGIGGGVALLVGAFVVMPHGRELAEQLVGVKTDLVREQADVTVGRYFYLSGTPGGLAILAVPAALVAIWRGRGRRSALAPLLLGVLTVCLWLRTHDYGYAAPGFLSLLTAYAVVEIAGWLPRVWLRAVFALLVAAGVLAPILAGAVVPVQRSTASLKNLQIIDESWMHALRWLKAHSPPLVTPVDTPVKTDGSFHHPKGDYGVVAFWDFGHFIAAIAERLPLASGGISGGLAHWFYLEDEADALKPEVLGLRAGTDLRYAMVDARTASDFVLAGLQMAGLPQDDYKGQTQNARFEGKVLGLWRFSERFRRTMVSRLYYDDGSGLAHFRLVYESPERSALYFTATPIPDDPKHSKVSRRSVLIGDPNQEKLWRQIAASGMPAGVTGVGVVYDVAVAPTVKVFEIVPGAVLEGTAQPGAIVEARLVLKAKSSGDTVAYARAAQADGEGHYRIEVAHPTVADPDSDLVPAGAYDVSTGGAKIGSAAVPLADVRSGGHAAVQPAN